MGCDIHIIAEVKENGEWKRNTDPVFKNPWYREDEKDKPKDQQWKFALEPMSSDPPSGRNYDWFSILADVRNGSGFAGVNTGQGFDVITGKPRGLPTDISDEGLKYFCLPVTENPELFDKENDGNYYVDKETALSWIDKGYSKLITVDGEEYVTNPDYHSDNYVTAEDFENFDWNQVTIKTGTISLNQYTELRGTNKCPEVWSASISGGDHITVSEEQADNILDGDVGMMLSRKESIFSKTVITKPASEWTINVQYNWTVLYSEWFKYNIENTVQPLKELAEKYEDARIVFSFDN